MFTRANACLTVCFALGVDEDTGVDVEVDVLDEAAGVEIAVWTASNGL